MIRSIVILVLMLVINAAVIFAIIRLVKRTDENMQKFFLDKAGDFLPEQNDNTENISSEAENKVQIIKQVEPKYMVNEIDEATYKNADFNKQYKNVKEEMGFDKNDVVLDVISSNEDDQEEDLAETFKSIAESFDFNTIYELSTVSINRQLQVLQSVFNDKQKTVLSNYLRSVGNASFDISSFFSYIKEQAKLLDENYYVKTGSKEENYDDVADNVVTVHDDGIVEGIKVVHKNKMYDYSI